VALAPGSVEAWGELGWAQFQIGNLSRAKEATNAALQIARPGHRGPLYYNLARVFVAEGKRDEAVDAYEASFADSPTQAALDGLAVVISGDSADPFALSEVLEPLVNRRDYCRAGNKETVSCGFDKIDDRINDVRWLTYEFSAGLGQPIFLRHYLTIDNAHGTFILAKESWRDWPEGDATGTTWKLESYNVVRMDILGRGVQEFVITWHISVRLPREGYLYQSFLRVCMTDDSVVVRCTSPIVPMEETQDGDVRESYSLDYDFQPPGGITFRLPLNVRSAMDISPSARRLLGTHAFHVPQGSTR
jgi:hypothetical protein